MNNINLPKSWNDVLVDQYIELKKMDEDNLSFFDRQINIISILTDTLPDDEIFEDLDVRDLTKLMTELKWVKTEPNKNNKKNVNDLLLVDFNKLTLGEYIDLNYYIENNYWNNFTRICGVLYKKTKIDEWGRTNYEDYEYNLDERAITFNELSINDVYGTLLNYLDYRGNFINTYSNLFEPDIPEDNDFEYDAEEIQEIEDEKKLLKWSWENILYKFSKGDITKHKDILKLPVIYVFNHLSYLKDTKQL